jgi:hypothetical protein
MVIYPGHGNETTIKEEKKYYVNDFWKVPIFYLI